MAPSKTTRPRPPAPKPKPERNTGMIVVIAVAAVAILAIGVAVISQLGKGGSSGQQTQPVVVEGTALPAYVLGSETDAAVGQVPPMLEGKSFDGTPITIDPGNGTPKVVIFAAHWCPHCQAEVPRIVEWQQAGLVPAGVEVIGVSTGTTSTRPNYPPSEWLADEGWPFPTMADAADNVAAEAWGLSTYPFFVALDADGKVVQRASGELTQEQFVALVNSVAAEG
jgi:cytochrome c biogenesis protein CcmG/thiol:disulfide interchange protein DsbE